ncbi:hypothetical protein CYMTET_17942 [Cymbomonas tetramitiformis]|uniref:Uncharacterized protein n=1 Tax=Cymbomonas tetramitiformis TaxID=36881 RepID=A0AAE0L6G2_9CHLO|nr:hypothetical protein CYMTET_17942 [Cymbomonas tetramitiformis]
MNLDSDIDLECEFSRSDVRAARSMTNLHQHPEVHEVYKQWKDKFVDLRQSPDSDDLKLFAEDFSRLDKRFGPFSVDASCDALGANKQALVCWTVRQDSTTMERLAIPKLVSDSMAVAVDARYAEAEGWVMVSEKALVRGAMVSEKMLVEGWVMVSEEGVG